MYADLSSGPLCAHDTGRIHQGLRCFEIYQNGKLVATWWTRKSRREIHRELKALRDRYSRRSLDRDDVPTSKRAAQIGASARVQILSKIAQP